MFESDIPHVTYSQPQLRALFAFAIAALALDAGAVVVANDAASTNLLFAAYVAVGGAMVEVLLPLGVGVQSWVDSRDGGQGDV